MSMTLQMMASDLHLSTNERYQHIIALMLHEGLFTRDDIRI